METVENIFSKKYLSLSEEGLKKLGGPKAPRDLGGSGRSGKSDNLQYRIVASTNTCYYSENQLFVKRLQYIRTENPLHKQSEKARMCF